MSPIFAARNDELPPLICALLAHPECYDHPVEKIELIQTHISWVILTGRYAYKIKKPLDLGFLNFSTLALRREDCFEELRLNRRLAPEFYLDVAAISGSASEPNINGTGEVIEYAVKMRQFPPEATLDRLDERNALLERHVDALAARMAHFHLHECALDEGILSDPELIARPVLENFDTLVALLTDEASQATLIRLKSWLDAEYAKLSPLMSRRRVRECHGDLHLGNIAWVDDEPVIFDCLEFNPALRWIDAISEIAFCYMDLRFRRHDALAMRFLNAWLEVSGDYQGVALLRYYAVYRAMVRAKVAVLRADDAAQQARDYLMLAERLMQPVPLQLCITHGYSGSGKTTGSQHLLQNLGMIRLRSDVERKRLSGLGALDKGGIYTSSFNQITYQYLANQAEALLKAGWPVIVDAAFLARALRDEFCSLAERCGVNFCIVDMQVDSTVLRERVLLRSALNNDASEADIAVLEEQMKTAQPLGEDELAYVIHPDLF